MQITLVQLFTDLLIAAVLGGAVGVQRQAAQKPAGFRTHLLVALGSCAFTEIGRFAGDDRIAANVLTGIGFLGAGAILRYGTSAHGLTTAASIWTVAAVGVAVGFGHPYSIGIGIAVTLITLGGLSISDTVFSNIFPRRASITLIFAGKLSHHPYANVFSQHRVHFLPTGECRVTNSPEGTVSEARYHVTLPRGAHLSDLLSDLAAQPGVRAVAADAPVENVL